MKLLIILATIVAATCADQRVDGLAPADFVDAMNTQNIQPTISNGTLASLGQFPYQAAIFTEYDSRKFVCGGALIKHKWVLTAASCVKAPFENPIVKLGTINSLLGENVWESKIIPTANIKIHYNYTNDGYRRNIALLYLADMPDTVMDNPSVGTIDLPNESELNTNLIDKTATVSGYGATVSFSTSTDAILRYGAVIIVQNSSCSVLVDHKLSESSLCAAPTNGKQICGGDQGSPLVLDVSGGRKILIGIANLPVNDCANYPALFENILLQRDWIQETINGSQMIQMSFTAVAVAVVMIFKNIF